MRDILDIHARAPWRSALDCLCFWSASVANSRTPISHSAPT